MEIYRSSEFVIDPVTPLEWLQGEHTPAESLNLSLPSLDSDLWQFTFFFLPTGILFILIGD